MAARCLLHGTRWLPELKNRKSSNDISSLANGLISKYLHRSVPPMALNENTKMAPLGWTKWWPELKIVKSLKDISLRSQCPDFKVISRKCSSYGPLPKLQKKFCSTTKWPPELKIEKNLLTSPPWPVAWFQNDFTEMFLLSPFTKIAKWFCSAEQNGHQSWKLKNL